MTSVNQPKTGKKATLTGNFKSLKGVMHHYSCYCYNVGELTLDNGKKVPVCFPDDQPEITCTRIRVKGTYETTHVDASGTNPCGEGDLTYLKVISYTCK